MKAFVTWGLRNHDQGRDFREEIQKILAKQP